MVINHKGKSVFFILPSVTIWLRMTFSCFLKKKKKNQIHPESKMVSLHGGGQRICHSLNVNRVRRAGFAPSPLRLGH